MSARDSREAFETVMSMRGLSTGLRDEDGFYIAQSVEQRWQFWQEGVSWRERTAAPRPWREYEVGIGGEVVKVTL